MDLISGMRVFVSIANNGSLAKAGRELDLSPSVVSKHISALEDRLGARLLYRTTRSVSLTEVGLAYLDRARRIIGDVDEAKAKSIWSIVNLKIAFGLSEEKAREWGLYISKSIKESESAIFCEPGLFIIKEDGSLYLANTSNMPWARPDVSTLPAKLVFAEENEYPVRGNF